MARKSSFSLEWQGYTPAGEMVTMYAKYIDYKGEQESSYTLRILTHDNRELSLIVRSEDYEGLESMSSVDKHIAQEVEHRDLVKAVDGKMPEPQPVMQLMF